MKKYSSLKNVNVFTKLQQMCENIRDNVLLPLRNDLDELKDRVEKEKKRLKVQESEEGPENRGPKPACTPRSGGNPDTGPGL